MPLQPVLPLERIAQSLLVIRGQKVRINAHLAALYGVAIKRLMSRSNAISTASRRISCFKSQSRKRMV